MRFWVRVEIDKHCSVAQGYPVNQTFASWNQFVTLLRRLNQLRALADQP